jgi:D-psicose/D-tagatose/L-ribulose 3-epimerase
MKYGICYCYWNKNWEGTDYPKFIGRARKCGFDVLEIFYGRTLEMEQPEIDEIKAACREYDVEIYVSGGFGDDYYLTSFDEDVRRKGVANAIKLLKAMARLGAHNFSGINYAPWCNFEEAFGKKKATEQAAKSLKEIGKACADYDFSWNMEVVNRFEGYLLNIADEATVLCNMVDDPHINILLDSFHGMIEEDSLGDSIRKVGKEKLGHYHMGTNNRRPPRPGIIPFDEICKALKDINYEKCVSFEPLVRTGGSVALEGGNVWRPMLPADIDDTMLDDIIIESRKYIEKCLAADK